MEKTNKKLFKLVKKVYQKFTDKIRKNDYNFAQHGIDIEAMNQTCKRWGLTKK